MKCLCVCLWTNRTGKAVMWCLSDVCLQIAISMVCFQFVWSNAHPWSKHYKDGPTYKCGWTNLFPKIFSKEKIHLNGWLLYLLFYYFSIAKATLQTAMSVHLSVCQSVSHQNPSASPNHAYQPNLSLSQPLCQSAIMLLCPPFPPISHLICFCNF